jgi:hypothetical protein
MPWRVLSRGMTAHNVSIDSYLSVAGFQLLLVLSHPLHLLDGLLLGPLEDSALMGLLRGSAGGGERRFFLFHLCLLISNGIF